MINVNVGDKVYMDCITSMGASSTGTRRVTKIIKKFDEDTGAPYNVIYCDESSFDSRTGDGISSMMFYIEQLK